MSSALVERLAELRRAGAELRERPVQKTLESLASVFDGWCAEGSAWQRELATTLPTATGFSVEGVSEGLRRGLASWSGKEFLELVEAELGTDGLPNTSGSSAVSGFDLTATFLAGSIPMPTLLAMVAPLALRSPVIVKTAARDPLTAHHVARSISQCDELLGRCVACVDFPRSDESSSDALVAADCVVATGSDATVANLAERVPPTSRFVAYGHRLSVAAVGSEALHRAAREDAARRLALDVALWDQLGCLSPVAVYVIGDDGAVDGFAEDLAEALAAIEGRLRRGAVARAAAAQISFERGEAEMRAAAGARVIVHAATAAATPVASATATPAATGWTVIREATSEARPAPLHRFIRVHPVSDTAGLVDAIAPLGPHLAAVGMAGFGRAGRATAQQLAALGASRICPLGAMQTPPLAWRHDNRPVLVPLARYVDIEIPG